jgi:hypothetical protein
MDSTFSASAPDLSYRPKEPKFKVRVLWKWSFMLLAVLMAWGMWQCGSALVLGARLADEAVAQFHERLDAGQYDMICEEAIQGFCSGGADGEAARFLKGVHEKLGMAGVATRGNLNVTSTTSGTFVRVEYETKFAIGSAVETFTWMKDGNTLKLRGYNVQSNALFLQ